MDQLLTFLSVSSGVKFLTLYLNQGKKPSDAEFVGEVSDLLIYPVKCCRGVSMSSALCTRRGLKHPSKALFDRNFVVVTNDGDTVYATIEPVLTTITCKVKDGLVLEAEGMPPLQLPFVVPTDYQKTMTTKVIRESVEGQDCGEEAAQWLSKCIGKPGVRLLYGAKGLANRQLNKQEDKWKHDAKDSDYVTFQNGFPYLLANRSSLNDLNTKLPSPIEMDRFRPNIVVTASKPFDEDNWKHVWIGNMKFTHIKPCNRCPSTTLDPKDGSRSQQGEPLRTLRTFRLEKEHFGESPIFGSNLILDTPPGVVHVGDPVFVKRGKVLNK